MPAFTLQCKCQATHSLKKKKKKVDKNKLNVFKVTSGDQILRKDQNQPCVNPLILSDPPDQSLALGPKPTVI